MDPDQTAPIKEQSDLGLHCLSRWLPQHFSRRQTDNFYCDWRFKGSIQIFKHALNVCQNSNPIINTLFSEENKAK